MASIIKKNIRGKPYYYARESKRVDGKPKIVWQKYLGTPQQIIDVMTGMGTERASDAGHWKRKRFSRNSKRESSRSKRGCPHSMSGSKSRRDYAKQPGFKECPALWPGFSGCSSQKGFPVGVRSSRGQMHCMLTKHRRTCALNLLSP